MLMLGLSICKNGKVSLRRRILSFLGPLGSGLLELIRRIYDSGIVIDGGYMTYVGLFFLFYVYTRLQPVFYRCIDFSSVIRGCSDTAEAISHCYKMWLPPITNSVIDQIYNNPLTSQFPRRFVSFRFKPTIVIKAAIPKGN